MPATDPAVQLARELDDLRRRLAAVERGSQGAYRSLVVDGESVTLPQVVRTGREASETATVAFQAANGKNSVTFSPTDPDPDHDGVTEGDVWFRLDSSGVITGSWEWDGATWAEHSFGDEVLNSLTVGKLVTGEMAVGQRIIFGPAEGTHAEGSSTGFRVFREDPVDGIPDEVARMGTTLPDGTPTNDYFAILSADGGLAASIDDSGSVNSRTASFTEDITVAGRSVLEIADSNRLHTHGYAFAGITNVTSEIGLVEIAAPMEPGRIYEVSLNVTATRTAADSDIILRVRDGGAGVPSLGSTEMMVFQNSTPEPGRASSLQLHGYTAVTTGGLHRLLMTVARQGSGAVDISNASGYAPALVVIDHGPITSSTVGSVNRGGGGTAPPLQQYDTGEMPPSAWASYRGDGSQRFDVPGPVQGWDPSGYNGNGKGHWSWGLPSITGTVDRVDVYLYSEHWYYNSGGTAIINGAVAGNAYAKIKGDFYVGGFPKPGGRWVTLPSDWFPYFKTGGVGGVRFDGITVGPGPGTDVAYYGRFTGSAARLRIWYTQ